MHMIVYTTEKHSFMTLDIDNIILIYKYYLIYFSIVGKVSRIDNMFQYLSTFNRELK